MRGVILLLLVVLSGGAYAQSANEPAAPLRGVLDGGLETHFNLPVDNPVAYASGFEYLDELDRLCPGNTPKNPVGLHDTMYSTFAGYKLLFVKGEKLPGGTSFMTGVGVLLARIPEAVAPVKAFKQAEAKRGAPVREPDWKLEQQFESYLRIQKYKAAYGTKLCEMAASAKSMRKGIPNYLAMRDVEPLVDMRASN